MPSIRTRGFVIISLITLVVLSTACGSPAEQSELPPGVRTVCEISIDDAGQTVEVGGKIIFVDDSDPSGYYADLEYQDCRVGIMVDAATWSEWTDQARSRFSIGAEVVATGLLAQYPMPARPDEYQLIVELQAPLRAIGEIPALSEIEMVEALPPITEPACEYQEVDYSMDLEMFGTIVVFDDEAAAGIYGELDDGYCVTRLWVERTRWDSWEESERAVFHLGSNVVVEGILTPVLNEPVLDLSYPPRQND